MKRVLDMLLPLLRVAYAILEYATPKRDTACFMSFPDADDNALYVFKLALAKRSECQLVWLAQEPAIARRRLMQRTGTANSDRYSVVKKNSIRGIYHFLRSKRVYATHGHYPFVTKWPNRRKLINLWHGMPIKAIGLYDEKKLQNSQTSHASIASSSSFANIIAKAFDLPLSEVAVTGLPRCDELLAPHTSREQLYTILNRRTADYRHTICWLPTFSRSHFGHVRQDTDRSDEEIIRTFSIETQQLADLAERYNCLIVLKLHPMDFLNTIELTLPKNIAMLANDGTNPLTTYELLSVADGLISDLSSVIFDFMCTRRPILISTKNIGSYTRGRVLDIDELLQSIHQCEDFSGSQLYFDAVVGRHQYPTQALVNYNAFFDTESSRRVLERFPLPATMS